MIMTRRDFLMASSALAVGGCRAFDGEGGDRWSDGVALCQKGGIRVRFLGSGASGWKPEWAKNPHMRRQSSVLIENKVLVDFTSSAFDMLPSDCRPEVLFQTHSHGDHYDPEAAVRSGVRRMYVQETWATAARREVEAAADRLGLSAPRVIALPFAQPVTVCGLTVTGVPANHSTSRVTAGVLERTSLYLIEKGPSRLLYATDTGGIPGDAARMVGIDHHIRPDGYGKRFADNPMVCEPSPITAFVMEATNGDVDDDFRIFVHSSVQTVARIVNAMEKTGRFTPPPGQYAYLTHLGIKYRGWSAERIDAEIHSSLRAAYDGLETVLG